MTTYKATDIGPFIPNKENALQLIEWLENGAMHSAFNIKVGVSTPYQPREFEENLESAIDDGTYEATGKGACGAVCCIAGAASQMQRGIFGSIDKDRPDWGKLQTEAFDFLGIPESKRDEVAEEQSGMWLIFDPDEWESYTDEPVTGKMAAQALVYYSRNGDECDAILCAS